MPIITMIRVCLLRKGLCLQRRPFSECNSAPLFYPWSEWLIKPHAWTVSKVVVVNICWDPGQAS